MTARWVPATCRREGHPGGRICRHDWLANRLVDKLAGEAAPELLAPAALCAGVATVEGYVREAYSVVMNMFTDRTPRGKWPDAVAVPRPERQGPDGASGRLRLPRRLPAGGGHDWVGVPYGCCKQRFLCRGCG